MDKLPTLFDLAKAAGVSKATASNVFSWPERVRPSLRERVEAAALRIGYTGPDPKGRLLSGGKANAIGVVPPGAFGISIAFSNPYMRDFLSGVADVCEEYSAGLYLVSGKSEQKAKGVRNAIVDGFILNGADEIDLIEPAMRHRVPIVVMDVDGDQNISSVRIDDRAAARLITQHLVDLGHRHFAILSVLRDSTSVPTFHGPTESHHRLIAGFPVDRDRLSGVADVLKTIGISIDDVPIVETFGATADDASFGGAAAGAALLLDNSPEATAIIALGDTQELAVLAEARRRGIHVPQVLSVVGFDDPPQAATAEPPLTTIAQPAVEKGRTAARILFEGGPPRHIVLPVALIIRQSTAPPRS